MNTKINLVRIKLGISYLNTKNGKVGRLSYKKWNSQKLTNVNQKRAVQFRDATTQKIAL